MRSGITSNRTLVEPFSFLLELEMGNQVSPFFVPSTCSARILFFSSHLCPLFLLCFFDPDFYIPTPRFPFPSIHLPFPFPLFLSSPCLDVLLQMSLSWFLAGSAGPWFLVPGSWCLPPGSLILEMSTCRYLPPTSSSSTLLLPCRR